MWYTLDPASLLVTSHFHDGLDELPPEWLANEYYAGDVNKLADVARSKRGVSTLHEATGGDPTSSPRWHFNTTMGGDQELIVALRTVTGEAWGALGLYREPGAPLFDREDLGLVHSLAPSLAEGTRPRPARRRGDGPGGTGVAASHRPHGQVGRRVPHCRRRGLAVRPSSRRLDAGRLRSRLRRRGPGATERHSGPTARAGWR